MVKIKGNWLLIASVVAVALYWSVAAFVPGAFMSAIGSLALLAFGGVSFVLYSETAFRVVVMGDRSGEDDGSHLAVYGTWLLGAGAVWSGLFVLAWLWYGQPASWTGTASSSFGRHVMAIGFLLMFMAPQTSQHGIIIKRSAWLFIALALAMSAGVWIGANLNGPDRPNIGRLFLKIDGSRPQCPPDRKVWVASNSRLYHTADSRYRAAVVPRRCFRTEAEAKSAGFIAAR